MKTFIFCFVTIILTCCQSKENSTSNYFQATESGVRNGGVKMIPITTPIGEFKVWTKRFGNNPRIKVLLLHGGPGITHEQLECFESFFPHEGFEFYEYDQLGSYYSDQPKDTSLWDINRMVDEVEQVRVALGLNNDNFYLFGHSWGGMLAMQYALKHQQNLKGLIVANMFSNASAQNKYWQTILDNIELNAAKELRALDSASDYQYPKFSELLIEHIMKHRGLRAAEMPEPMARAFKHYNSDPDNVILGPGGFSVKGKLANVEIMEELKSINVPSLFIAGAHDFIDPKHIEAMSSNAKHGQYLLCLEGSHNAMWDDQQRFMEGVIDFIIEVDQEKE